MPVHASAHPDAGGAAGTPPSDDAEAEAEHTALKHLRTYLATADTLLPHIDGAQSPIIVTSTDLSRSGPQILYANQAFRDMTGYRLDEILGDTLDVFEGPDSDVDAEADLRRDLIDTGFARAELVRYRKDGERFRTYVTASRMSDEAPGAGVFLFVENDVSATS